MAAALHEVFAAQPLPGQVRRVTATVAGSSGAVMHHHFTFRPSAAGMAEERLIRGLHPHIAERMRMERLREFDLTRLPSSDEEVYLYQCVARGNPSDDRLVAFAQVRDLTGLRDHDGNLRTLPTAEYTIATCLDSIRSAQERRPSKKRLPTNRIVIYVWPPSDLTRAELEMLVRRMLPTAAGAGLEEIEFIARRRVPETGELAKVGVRISFDATGGTTLTVGEPSDAPVEPVDGYRQKVLRASSRNTVYPYELTEVLGTFAEHDLDDDHALVPVDRPKGRNTAAIVAGVVTTPTRRHAQGVTRVVLLGDPTKALGALSEPECRRVIAALDLAERMRVPLEWYALSAGARISMESGTENMDWVAAALKRIVEFTQDGGEINVVVAGINVGAQPYWNAEATMLMHTKGVLVMTPDSAMVLTGKQSLDFSGGVSAEDNFGIGGYDRVMGPNGQAQYWAPNLVAARDVLMAHYDHTYVAPGEDVPRRATSSDPVDRDVSDFPHTVEGSDFTTVGEIFSAAANPDRKKPFDIRTVMRALSDQDHPVLERWAGMADAETAVVQDVHLGGMPVCLLGIESRSVPRRGFPPTDGPDLHRGHAVPAVVQEGRAGDQLGQRQPPWWCWRTCRASTAPRVTAQAPAGVRRRDRPRHRELPRPHRVLRDLALPRRRVRGVLQGAEPEHDRPRAGRLVRLGARRRPGRRRGVRPRRGRPHRRRPARPGPGRPRHRGHRPRTRRPPRRTGRTPLVRPRGKARRGRHRVRRRPRHPPSSRGRLRRRRHPGRRTPPAHHRSHRVPPPLTSSAAPRVPGEEESVQRVSGRRNRPAASVPAELPVGTVCRPGPRGSWCVGPLPKSATDRMRPLPWATNPTLWD